MNTQSTPENSADIDRLADRLRKAAIGDIVSYAELTSLVCGVSVQGKARYKMDSAITRLRKQDSIVFGCVFNEGLKRLNDAETAMVGDQTRKKIRGTAKRGLQKMFCAKADALNVEQRNRLYANQSLLGAIGNLSKSSAVKEVEQKLPHERLKLFLSNTLQAFQ